MAKHNLPTRLAALEKAADAAGPRRGGAELNAALRFAWDHPGGGDAAVWRAMMLMHGDGASERFGRDLMRAYGKPGDGNRSDDQDEPDAIRHPPPPRPG